MKKNLKQNFSDYNATTIDEAIKAIKEELENYYTIVDSEAEAEKELAYIEEKENLHSELTHSFALTNDSDEDASWTPQYMVTITGYYYDSGSSDYVYSVGYREF